MESFEKRLKHCVFFVNKHIYMFRRCSRRNINRSRGIFWAWLDRKSDRSRDKWARL